MSKSNTQRTSAFEQVDVFTANPMRGNALAVILDADGMTDAAMQHVAAWTNLSETAFVLPPTRPEADYRLRIFTPTSELPFAGHPSVGAAHALLEGGRIRTRDKFVQECAAGLLPLRVVGAGPTRRIFVRSPSARSSAIETSATRALAHALGARPKTVPKLVTVGPTWLVCDLGDEAAVRALRPNLPAIEALCRPLAAIGATIFGRAVQQQYQLTVRAFCPGHGIPEDPATGSANAAIGSYLLDAGSLDSIGQTYRASQGREVGRDAFIDVCVDSKAGSVDIGGQSITCVRGTLVLPAS